MALRTINPDTLVLLEPYIDFMRAAELYNAERTQLATGKDASKFRANISSCVLDVQIIRYSESAEMFQSMSLFEDEKRRFKKLIELQ